MAAPSEKLVELMLSEFRALTNKPEDYLGVQPKVSDKFKKVTKKVYDYLKDSESKTNEALPELIINRFDDEQIWQEIELQNESAINSLLASVSQVRSSKNVGFQLSDESPSSKPAKKILKSTKRAVEKSSCLKDRLDIDEDEMNFEENSEAENEDDADENKSDNDTDTEIDRIKSRLSVGLGSDDEFSDENSDDLDFNFGGENDNNELGNSGDENNDEQETPTDRIILEDDSQRKTKNSSKTVSKEKTSVVDDKFFKLSQMEVFLEQEDRREAKLIQKESGGKEEDESDLTEDEDVDIFGHLSSGEEEEEDKPSRKMKYADFFANPDGESAPTTEGQGSDDESHDSNEDERSADGIGDDSPSKKKVRFADKKSDVEENSDSDENPDTPADLLANSDSEGEDMADIFGGKIMEETSNFEKRQERLKTKISQMEEESIKAKPWQLSGEVSSLTRPENSLLEEYLQFDQTTKLPPVITEETTQTIEELITQRIKDQAWDDVERKVKPKEDPFEYKKRIVLDQEKSKLSLGEIYEQEYLKQQQKEEVEVKDPDHEGIKKDMRDLFVKLDALCNFHFTPKPSAPDIKIVSNLPSISVEEVAPVSVSDATLLAPQEIQEKKKGEAKGNTEKSETDRNRDRREKKQAKRSRQKARDQRQKLITKLHPGLGNKYSKEKAMKELEKSSKQDTSVKIIKDDKKKKKSSVSSKTFFTQLQDEVVSQISKRKLEKTKNSKFSDKSSKKFKL